MTQRTSVSSTVPEAIQARMLKDERFDWSEIASWIASDNDELRGAAFDALMGTPPVVDGDVDHDVANGFLLDYLFLCMVNDKRVRSAVIFEASPPHVAAYDLSQWYRGLRARGVPHTDDMPRRIRDELKRLYLVGDDKQKALVVNGALEHIFESMRCRPDFQDWEKDPQLSAALVAAKEWADDHLALEPKA